MERLLGQNGSRPDEGFSIQPTDVFHKCLNYPYFLAPHHCWKTGLRWGIRANIQAFSLGMIWLEPLCRFSSWREKREDGQKLAFRRGREERYGFTLPRMT